MLLTAEYFVMTAAYDTSRRDRHRLFSSNAKAHSLLDYSSLKYATGGERMMTPHFYETEVGWMGKKRGFLQAPGLPSLEVASPPEFNGHEHTWTPEHLFVAAVNSCYMATFLAIAELSKLDFVSFISNAVGKLEKTEGQGYRITEIVLKPQLAIRFEYDTEGAARILEKAETNCLVSNSILTEVKLEPSIDFEVMCAHA